MKFFLSALVLSLIATASQAALVAYTWDEGGAIKSEWSGTIDVTGLKRIQTTTGAPKRSVIQGHRTYFFHVPANYYGYAGATTSQATLGTDSTPRSGSFSGDGFGYLTDKRYLYLPIAYQNNTQMTGTAILNGYSLASLGFTTPLTYTMSWNTGSGTETITHYYGTRPPAVPLPAGLPLIATALGGLALLRRQRKAVSAYGKDQVNGVQGPTRTPAAASTSPTHTLQVRNR